LTRLTHTVADMVAWVVTTVVVANMAVWVTVVNSSL
jgi:hypothetical protein